MKIPPILLRGVVTSLWLAASCAGCLRTPPIPGFESALQHLEQDLLPAIQVDSAEPLPGSTMPLTGAALSLAERLPPPGTGPLQGAGPQLPAAAGVLRLEIVSSAE